ncbi:SusD family protein [Ekhidna lutea]|uniref:SusD family protein n=1 Tax=Ekhidna lutea TaxID=447679 RepID=A0A239LXF1_EKHLU|nr:RagB/SusD family nutrient uptake outer membrane protein [Ekhidna lutea]SNT34483.1 SusD family protein [Ekhidna lutea]
MKKFYSIIIILSFLSCTDLDLEPKNGLVESVAFENFEGYQSYIAKVYASLTLTGQQGAAGQPDLTIINDEGFSSYLRVWWKAQELTTDEAIIAWNDSGIRDLHNHAWGADNQFVRVLYYRIFYTISLANDFIRVAEDLPPGLSSDEIATINEYVAEARFIRAFSYWHALDHFRNIALITSITAELPTQVDPQVIFNFIESELNDIEDQLLPAGQSNHDYGRVDRAAAWMLKAKLYLNAEVYVGADRYSDCIEELNKVISSNVYSLAANYQELFMGDNHLRTDEIIWPIVHDGLVSQTWGGTTTIIRGGIGGAMSDDEKNGSPSADEAENDYGVPSGWAGYRTTSALVNKFPGAASDPNGNSADGRAIFFTEGQSLEIADVGEFTHGWAVPKFNNLEASTGRRAPGVDQVSTDYPVFRLGEAYLMLAEAELQENGTVSTTTLGYLNDLRVRAYGDNSGNIAAGDVTLDWILDERARELYLEATRRTDLIRHGKFSGGGYIWPWKGGVAEGMASPGHLDIFPIPSSDLIANPNLKQNDGY